MFNFSNEKPHDPYRGQEQSQYNKGQQHPIEDFAAKLAEYGLSPVEIIPGEISKFSTKEGDSRDQAGWCIFLEGDICGGAFGDWRTGFKGTWCSSDWKDLTSDQKQQHEKNMRTAAEKRKKAEQARAVGFDVKAKDAQAMLDAAQPFEVVGHDYPERKGIFANGYKVHISQSGHKALLIPKYRLSANGTGIEIRNVEHIWESPDMPKHGLSGAEPEGLFHVIQGRPGKKDVYIAEGFSTCMSIYMATGATVICTFNAGNMPKTAQSVKTMYPGWNIVVAGDNDQFLKPKPDGTPSNPGKDKAMETGKILGVPVIFPKFKDLSDKPTDFNDLMTLEGIDAVWDQLAAPETTEEIAPFFSGDMGFFLAESDNGTDEQRFIFSRPGKQKPGGLRIGVIGYEGGEGGSGKTRVWFQILASICFGHDFTGGAFDFHEIGPCLMVAGEDGRDIMAEISIMIRMRAREDNFEIPKDRETNFRFRCADGGTGSPCLFTRDGRNIVKTDGYAGLLEDCKQIRPVVLVLDSQSILIGMGEESNEDAGMVSGLLKVLLKYCMAIVIIAHTNKSSTSGKAMAKDWEQAWRPALSVEALRGSSGLVFNGRYLKMTTKVPSRFNPFLGADKEKDRLIACTIPKANGTVEVYDPFYFKQRLYTWTNNQGTKSHSVLWDHFEPSMTEAKRLAQEKTEAEAEEQLRVSKIVVDKIVEMVGKAGEDNQPRAGKKASPANVNQVAKAIVDISKSYALNQYDEVTRATRALEKRFKDSDGMIYTNDLKNVIELVEKEKGSYAHFIVYDPYIERGKDSEIGLFGDHETGAGK